VFEKDQYRHFGLFSVSEKKNLLGRF